MPGRPCLSWSTVTGRNRQGLVKSNRKSHGCGGERSLTCGSNFRTHSHQEVMPDQVPIMPPAVAAKLSWPPC